MSYSSLLLVEGKSDGYVIKEFAKQKKLNLNFEIRLENSLSELKTSFKAHLKSTNAYKKIWLIIDADNNFQGAWQSIKDILIKSGKYQLSHDLKLPVDGIVLHPHDEDDIVVGVWVMPNNSDVGMLEDFLKKLIPEQDSLYAKTLTIIDELESERDDHKCLYKEVHKAKAEIHTWLAWHDAPGESIGVAIQKRLFDLDKSLSIHFYNWLNKLND